MTAKPGSNFSGSAKVTYDIYERGMSLNNSVIEPRTIPAVTYTGEAVNLEDIAGQLSVTLNRTALARGTDYEVFYAAGTDKVNAGTATIVIEALDGSGRCFGRKNATFKIAPKNIADAGITVNVADTIYDGSAQKPAVTVTHRIGTDDVLLTEGKDYTLSYSNNKNVADAGAGRTAPTVTVRGKGNYTGTTSATFTIEPITVGPADASVLISGIKSSPGRSIAASSVRPTVTYHNAATGKDVSLTKGRDYDITFVHVVSAGYEYVKVPVVFKGSYRNGAAVEGDVLIYTGPLDINGTGFTAEPEADAFGYTGSKVTPKISVKHNDGGQIRELVEGKDYRVSYRYNVNAADASARTAPEWTVTGIGSYKGSRSGKYTIVKRDLSDGSYAVTVPDIKCNGRDQKPSVKVIDLMSGKTLAATNYTLTYSSTKNATDAATVTVTGKGNYTGTLVQPFRVYEKQISTAVFMAVPNQAYTGRQVTPSGSSVQGYIDRTKSVPLVEGVDYTLSYGENTKTGTGTVIVTGKGSYGGTTTLRFRIVPKWLQWTIQ